MVVKLRSEIDDKFKWNLKDLYNDIEDLEKEYKQVKNDINRIGLFEGILCVNKNLKECYDNYYDISKRLSRMFCYASRWFDQEQDNEDADKLLNKIRELYTDFGVNTSFISSEIKKFDDETVEMLLNDDLLSVYHNEIKEINRFKKHFLSKVEEELLTKISDVYSTSDEVYTIFKNTELKYTTVNIKGKDILIDVSNFSILRESNDIYERKIAFDTFFRTYNDYKNTFSKLIYKSVKSTVVMNKIRNFNSSLESSLFSDNIPVDIYNNLIYNVNKNLYKFHEYLNLRKNVLGLDTLNYYDLSNSITKEVDNEYTYENAKEIVLNSLNVLGDDYIKIMEDAFKNEWIDVFPNKNKDTGAYMCGSAYDVHPYILLNYNDKYNAVSTLAHELGHAAHSVYSNNEQPYNKSSYSTYIAEIASTVNEVLLLDYMLKNTDDKDTKIFLLNNYINNFRTTVFRQTMFAEFEKFMYETVEKDEVLTSSVLNNKYFELLKTYHGDVFIDELYSNEWMYVPHFYYNFYVYQYATSYISSIIIASKILNGDKEQLIKYKDLLKSGCSDYPTELLKKCGVDLSDDKCYDVAFSDFSKYLDDLKKYLF